MASKLPRFSLAAVGGALCLAAPLHANRADAPPVVAVAKQEPGSSHYSATVTYRDLNLLSDEGVQRLQGRVRLAAKLACGQSDAGSSYYEIRQSYKHCVDQSVLGASSAIDLAVASARSGGRLASRGFSIRIARR